LRSNSELYKEKEQVEDEAFGYEFKEEEDNEPLYDEL
jgi:hypothetical protein